MTTKTKRPDMREYFRSQISRHVHGMMSTAFVVRPDGVVKITGDVTSRIITVEMQDGTEWQWEGGRYASRKVNLCYAPLMPTPIDRLQP